MLLSGWHGHLIMSNRWPFQHVKHEPWRLSPEMRLFPDGECLILRANSGAGEMWASCVAAPVAAVDGLSCSWTMTLIGSASETFQPFQYTCPESQFPSFALRSRIKTLAANRQPDFRFSRHWQNQYSPQGHQGLQGNKASQDTFPPQLESAPCIQQLFGKGVSIVGKSKMTSFVNWEEPLECVDFQAPFNPRGDGYQCSGGSSSRSADAVAVYD